MIIGNGLLANAFESYRNDDSILIFASGVSNSLETKEGNFARERTLLLNSIETNSDKLFIYFSTCSIEDTSVSDRPYIKHKLAMESLVEKHCKKYFIFRLSNIFGKGGNPNTILNHLINKVSKQEALTIWKFATRNILDVDDVAKIISEIIQKKESNSKINIAHTDSFPILEIVKNIEQYFDIDATIELIDKGEPVLINIEDSKDLITKILDNKKHDKHYIQLLLEKYCDNKNSNC